MNGTMRGHPERMHLRHGDALLNETVEEVCAHTAWDDGCHTDTILASLDAEAATETDQAPLGGMVGGSIRPGAGGGCRGYIDDMAGGMLAFHYG